jgi:hypothetical protein
VRTRVEIEKEIDRLTARIEHNEARLGLKDLIKPRRIVITQTVAEDTRRKTELEKELCNYEPGLAAAS